MNSHLSPITSSANRFQRGQNMVEFAFIVATLAVMSFLLLRVSGASNSDLVARVNCTIQGHQWADAATTASGVQSPLYGCLKAGVMDASFHSSRDLGSRSSYLPGMIFDTNTHRRIG